ncbi:MAG: hypothetical protein JSS75_07425 [Bacteroidetes bacterium]|nr:hypothetical protein [Bacteroidota bacterium]
MDEAVAVPREVFAFFERMEEQVTAIGLMVSMTQMSELTIDQVAALKHKSGEHIRQRMEAIPRFRRAFYHTLGDKGHLITTPALLHEAESDIARGILI